MADYYRLKSLDEMLESIDIGMDVEFYLYNVRYNISWRNNKPFICMCPEGDAIFYLLNRCLMNIKLMEKHWRNFGKILK